MTMTLAVILVACATTLLVTYLVLFARQQRDYRRLLAWQRDTMPALAAQVDFTPAAEVPGFTQHLAVVDDLLPSELFQKLRAAALQCRQSERTYLPRHKKGGTISYAELHRVAPEIVAFYQSPRLREFCSAIAGVPLVPTPIHDQSSCSLLFYDRSGDHIGWHYDHNFYRGRHFTVLVPLVNEHHETGQLSSARFMVRRGSEEVVVPTPPNSFILFEGAEVRHKVTPLGENETRVIFSMTFCTAPEAPVLRAIARRVKDTAFFGIRALWT
jgi:hypothetical protein